MYLSAMRYPVFFYPLHLYVFVLICQYYVVLLERTNKDIIYIYIYITMNTVSDQIKKEEGLAYIY